MMGKSHRCFLQGQKCTYNLCCVMNHEFNVCHGEENMIPCVDSCQYYPNNRCWRDEGVIILCFCRQSKWKSIGSIYWCYVIVTGGISVNKGCEYINRVFVSVVECNRITFGFSSIERELNTNWGAD